MKQSWYYLIFDFALGVVFNPIHSEKGEGRRILPPARSLDVYNLSNKQSKATKIGDSDTFFISSSPALPQVPPESPLLFPLSAPIDKKLTE